MSDPTLKDALVAVRSILRRSGLQHLAAQVPVQAAGDLQEVRNRIEIIDGLLELRPPDPETQKVLAEPWRDLKDQIKID